MKKALLRYLSSSAALGLFIVIAAIAAFPSAVSAEEVSSFDSVITLSKNNVATVQETIVYDFGNADDRHGIYRTIPFEYAGSAGIEIHPIQLLSIVDENNRAHPYEQTIKNGTVTWKIGKENTEVTGKHTYTITYTFEAPVNAPITDTQTQKRLAWNVTGNEWVVPIVSASATIRFDDSISDVSELGALECFVGTAGTVSSEDDCMEKSMKGGRDQQFIAEKPLQPGSGMTVQVDIPRAMVEDPTALTVQSSPASSISIDDTEIGRISNARIAVSPGNHRIRAQRFTFATVERGVQTTAGDVPRIQLELSKPWYWWFLQYNVPIILTVLYAIWVVHQWHTKGKEPNVSKIVVTEFEVPEKIGPLQIGGLMDQYVSTKELSSQIIYFATQGLLSIRRESETGIFDRLKKPEYTLMKLADIPAVGGRFANGYRVHSADVLLFDTIFGAGAAVQTEVSMKTLRTTLPSKVSAIQKEVYKNLVADGYFAHSPAARRFQYYAIAVCVAAAGIGIMIYLDFAWFWLALTAAGIVGGVLARFMGKRTQHGAKAFRKLQGYQRYLEIAEKERITFFNDPLKYQQLFEAVLPFAMVLGVERAWASHFDGLYQADPAWYQSAATFVPVHFISDMQSFSSQIQTSSQPVSSGGGGSSGGGFGGGGGGSW